MTISEIRAAVAADVAAATGLAVAPTVPEQLRPPCVLLTEADPWVTLDRFGGPSLRFAATVVARPGDNAGVIRTLDEAVAGLLTLANRYGLEVGAYVAADHNGQTYLTAPATLTTEGT